MRKVKPHQIQQYANQKLNIDTAIADAKISLKYPHASRGSFYSTRFSNEPKVIDRYSW